MPLQRLTIALEGSCRRTGPSNRLYMLVQRIGYETYLLQHRSEFGCRSDPGAIQAGQHTTIVMDEAEHEKIAKGDSLRQAFPQAQVELCGKLPCRCVEPVELQSLAMANPVFDQEPFDIAETRCNARFA